MSGSLHEALEVGKKLVELCSRGEHGEALEQLYAEDARHVEACGMGPDMPQVTEGKDALRKMSQWWVENHEVHGGETKGPYPHDTGRFAVWMSIDVTPKVGPMAGQRHEMHEICLYTVKGGKISQAEFFWDPTGYGE